MREASSYRVHLSQHRPPREEQRLPGVHDDQVEEGAPGLLLSPGLGVKTNVKPIQINGHFLDVQTEAKVCLTLA